MTSEPMTTGWLQRRWGLDVPLVGAPMAGPGGGRLAHAVSRAGALGMIGVDASRDPVWIEEQASFAGADSTRYGIGLMAWAHAKHPDQLATVIRLRPDLVSVSFGDFAAPIARLRDAGLTTATQVGNLADLDAALRCGVDVVVARGGEGGGHGRNELATLPLLQLVLAEVGIDIPVLAAGGILNHRGLAAVLAAGAAGAWVGTAFLGCTEAASTTAARDRLYRADATTYSRVFDVAQRAGWPREFGGRAVRNDYLDHWQGREDELDDPAAAQHAEAMRHGDYDVAHLYAGQGVAALTGDLGAASVVAEFRRAV